MPGANEVLGCPQIKQKDFYQFISKKFLTTFLFCRFSQFYLNFYFIFTIHLHKILTIINSDDLFRRFSQFFYLNFYFSFISKKGKNYFGCLLILDARGRQ